jgi:hypothetical protein
VAALAALSGVVGLGFHDRCLRVLSFTAREGPINSGHETENNCEVLARVQKPK